MQIGNVGQVKVDGDKKILDVIDKNKECSYNFLWGVIKFNKNFINFINPKDSHIGFSVVPAINSKLFITGEIIDGKYFDCGTIEEYTRLNSFLYNNDHGV